MKLGLMALLFMGLSFAAHAGNYGPYPQQTYQTCGSPSSATAVVLIHGGAWFKTSTTSPEVAELCSYLGLRKVYVVAINYRASTEAPWPAQLQDAQRAIRWVRSTVKAKRVGVIGMSAGGQIALFTAFTTRLTYARTDSQGEALQAQGISSHPDFVVDISGPTDLTADGLLPAGIASLTEGTRMSPLAARAFASPIVHITTNTSPLLIAHGVSDPVVPVSQSDDLVAALSVAGISVAQTDSGALHPAPVAGAFVTYDRHAGKHIFAGARLLPLFREILDFTTATGQFKSTGN
jgi:acetyl esterase/lipase